jgi:hypothetical protein
MNQAQFPYESAALGPLLFLGFGIGGSQLNSVFLHRYSRLIFGLLRRRDEFVGTMSVAGFSR